MFNDMVEIWATILNICMFEVLAICDRF